MLINKKILTLMKNYIKNIKNSRMTQVRIADSWGTMTNGSSLYYFKIFNDDIEDENVARYYTINDLENATIRKNKARLESQDSHEKFPDCEKVWDGYQDHYDKETTMKTAYTTEELEQLIKVLKTLKIRCVLFEVPKGDYPTRVSTPGENTWKGLIVPIRDKYVQEMLNRATANINQ